MFVGGEFYYDQAWITDRPSISAEGMYFLNGGAACLTVISDFLLDHGMDRVLLPSYLCPSIVKTFERNGIGWDFYQINENLSVNLDDLAQKASGFPAVYFINYFGFFHSSETRSFFRQLQQNAILLIEDNAQAGFPQPLSGDFALNSIRKLAPYDGGYLSTRFDMRPYIQKYAGCPNRRLPLIREYREKLYRYLYDKTGNYNELNDLFQRTKEYYETDLVILGDLEERQQIERLDWQAIRRVRRDNYQYMMNWVSSIPEITPIFPELQEAIMPFGLPVYFTGADRDRVNEKLADAGISLTIHWEDIATDPRTRTNRLAVDMAGRMLTLAVDQRTSHKQMDYLAMHLIRGIASLRSG